MGLFSRLVKDLYLIGQEGCHESERVFVVLLDMADENGHLRTLIRVFSDRKKPFTF